MLKQIKDSIKYISTIKDLLVHAVILVFSLKFSANYGSHDKNLKFLRTIYYLEIDIFIVKIVEAWT